MQTFFRDVVQNLESYYHKLVAATPKLLLAIAIVIIAWIIAAKVRNFTDVRLKKGCVIPYWPVSLPTW